MKKLLTTVLALVASATIASADMIEGTWQTQVDDGAYAHVRIAPCGAGYCGTIARTFNSSGEYQSENIGKQLVRSMVPQGNGNYAGQVWRPSNNKIYDGKAEVSGDRMVLKGCVAGGLICASQTWAKIN